MKKIIYICDRCGVEVEKPYPIENVKTGERLDLCPECTEDFHMFLAEFIQRKTEQKQPPKPKNEVKENGGARHKVKLDLGKVGALYAAGWAVKKIAEEMNCSEQTIRNHLNEAVQAYKEVMEEN